MCYALEILNGGRKHDPGVVFKELLFFSVLVSALYQNAR